MDDNDRGGLQVPNFILYQEAIFLNWIKEWLIFFFIIIISNWLILTDKKPFESIRI